MKDEWKLEAERFLFDFGKHVLGKNAGGMIKTLMRERGISAAWNVIKNAAAKSDPREYIGAAMKDRSIDATPQINGAEAERLIAKYREKRIREGWN